MTISSPQVRHSETSKEDPSHWASVLVGQRGHHASANQAAFVERLMIESIDLAIKEDLGPDYSHAGALTDLTSDAILDSSNTATGCLLLKEPAFVAGLSVFIWVMKRFDPFIEIELLVKDGSKIDKTPLKLATFTGPAKSILKAERLALNLLQRMCGIATLTDQFVALSRRADRAVLDTRKTTPGLRAFEKYAVHLAGGTTHRLGLYDSILIKDNHVRVAQGVTNAIQKARAAQPDLPIEVEVTSLCELQEAIAFGADTVLLDNMSPRQVAQAVDIVNGSCVIEVSGGINLNNFAKYLIPGVNAISIGALTHSAKNIDISLEVEEIL